MIYTAPYAVYEDCGFVLAKYSVNDAIALEIWDSSLEWCYNPIVRITMNVRGLSLGPDEVVVKDYSENEGVADWMESNGYASYTGKTVSVGYVTCPIMKLDMKKIKENCNV